MPIGFDPGDGGGGARPPGTAPRPPSPPLRPPPTEPVPPVPDSADQWERWREAYPVIWEAWQTSGDERVCPVCGPLGGQEFRSDVGPAPPLHVNCRCSRITTRIEWLLR